MLTLNRFSDIPVYEQIINGIERDILLEAIKEGDKLPSVRELAEILKTNPNTVQKAYAELHSRNVIITVASSGAFVSKNAVEEIRERKQALLEKIRELSYELYYAGIEESTVLNEVRSAFSFPQSNSDMAKEEFELPTRTVSKRKAKSTQKKVETQKKSEAKKEVEPKSKPIQKKKLNIELL